MDAHGREYLAAAEGVAETYGGPFPPIGSVVWYRYGRGVSSGKVLAMVDAPCGVAVRVQRSLSEILVVPMGDLQPAPRFMGTARPAVGALVWFRVDGGQARGVVEAAAPDGRSFLVRNSESAEVVEVSSESLVNF